MPRQERQHSATDIYHVMLKGINRHDIFEEGYCQAESYVNNSSQDVFTFCYYDRDHLGNIRQVTEADGSSTGSVIQTMNYYPFGAEFCDGSANSSVQSYKYNGKELDLMHGLNTYDYGARQYFSILGRWDRMDPLCEKYYSLSPYNYCGNNPINAIDKEGKLIIFINGFHWGFQGASPNYWHTDNGNFDDKVMAHFNDYNTLYYDGSLGGVFAGASNLSPANRYIAGYLQGLYDAHNIFTNLKRDENGNIVETIKIVTHSMGGAYGKGYAQALMKYKSIFSSLNDDNLNGLSISEYDFAPFEPTLQKAVKGVDTYQYSHTNDLIAGYQKIKGAHFTKKHYSKGNGLTSHYISSFIKYIKELPEGKYKVKDGEIVRDE